MEMVWERYRRGELYESLTHKTSLKMGARVTRPSGGEWFWRSGTVTRRSFHNDFEGVFGGLGGKADGGGGLCQREAMGNERAHVEPAGENEPGHFVLQREIGGVAAEQIFLVEQTVAGSISMTEPRVWCGQRHKLAAAAQPGLRLPHHRVRRNGDDGGVEAAAAGGAVDES